MESKRLTQNNNNKKRSKLQRNILHKSAHNYHMIPESIIKSWLNLDGDHPTPRSCEAAAGVLCPVVVHIIQERCGHTGEDPKEGH